MKIKMLIAINLIIACYSCSIQRTSKFSYATIKPGMDQQHITRIVGKPYKQTFYYGGDSALFETYYYKEAIWKSNWFEVNNILQFKNGKLIALEQGKEKHLYENNNKD